MRKQVISIVFGQTMQFLNDVVMIVVEQPDDETYVENPEDGVDTLVFQEALILHFHHSVFFAL